MKKAMMVILALLLVGVLLAKEAVDYDSLSLSELMEYAKNGDAEGQSALGYRYESGIGVAQDYTAALKWYRLAADQGNATAQFNIGVMYGKGLGVSKNMEQAYFWMLIAAANVTGEKYVEITEVRDKIGGFLTAAQRSRIQQEATAWMRERGFE